MPSKTYTDNTGSIDSDWLNPVDNWTYGPATKTIAKTLTPEDGVKIFPQGSDGGPFIGGTGKAVGYYDDDGGTAYGTRFKPTGGDGSAGWEREGVNGKYWGHWYGMDGGLADNASVFQAAVDAAEDELYLLGEKYITLSAVTIDKQLSLFGTGGSERTAGEGTQIRNNGTGEGLIYSSTVVIYDRTIKDMGITSVNGHALHIKHGAARCEFLNLRLDSRALDKSAVYADYSISGDGMYTNRFIGGEYFGSNTTNRTVPIVDLKTAGTKINENVFRDMWVSYSKGIMAMRIQATDPGVFITNNKFESITFEVCEGGLIYLSQCAHSKIDGVTGWDSPSYTEDLVTLDACTITTIIGYGRAGGTPDAGVVDIRAQGASGGGLTVISFSDVGATAEAIDWGGQTGNYIGAFSTTLAHTNDSRVVKIDGDNVVAPNYTAVDGDNAVLSATGDATARLSSEHTSVTRSADLDANTFYGGSGTWRPAVDNILDLGGSTVAWKTAYSYNVDIKTQLRHRGTLTGFYNATPIVQPSSTGETVGFTAGAGTSVNDDSTFTGNVGTTAYRISDIVKHLKNLGFLAQ